MNIIIFDGKYLNWVKNGKYRDYNEKGNLIFKCEYLYGKKWLGVTKTFSNYSESTENDYMYGNETTLKSNK